MNIQTQEQKVFAHDPRNGLRLREASAVEKKTWEAQPVRHQSFRKAIVVHGFLIDQESIDLNGILCHGVSD
jgi:hypothetical protein